MLTLYIYQYLCRNLTSENTFNSIWYASQYKIYLWLIHGAEKRKCCFLQMFPYQEKERFFAWNNWCKSVVRNSGNIWSGVMQLVQLKVSCSSKTRPSTGKGRCWETSELQSISKAWLSPSQCPTIINPHPSFVSTHASHVLLVNWYNYEWETENVRVSLDLIFVFSSFLTQFPNL